MHAIIYFTYLPLHTESMLCGPELYFDRSLFPFLTTLGYIQKLTVYEMPRVDCKFQPISQCEENIDFDGEISQFQAGETTLRGISFMQILDTIDHSMSCITSRLFVLWFAFCFAAFLIICFFRTFKTQTQELTPPYLLSFACAIQLFVPF